MPNLLTFRLGLPYIPDENKMLKQFGIASPTMDHITDADMTALAAAGGVLTGSSALCTVSIANIGKRTVTYSLKCDYTGRELWARVPKLKFWRTFDTRSSAATMLFAQKSLGLPVPEVLAWNNCPENLVRAPYLIMEKPSGVRFTDLDLWKMKSPEGILSILDSMARVHTLASQPVPFQTLGSLDFDTDAASRRNGVDLADTANYSIIPHLSSPSPPFQRIADEVPRADCPRTLVDFWKDILYAEMSALSMFDVAPQNSDQRITQKIIAEDIWIKYANGSRHKPDPQKLMLLGSIVHMMASGWETPKSHDPNLGQNCLVLSPTILSNIFVDPEAMCVTAIADFDGAVVGPFPLSLLYPERMTRSLWAPTSWMRTSGRFAEVPYGVLKLPDPGSPSYNIAVTELGMRQFYKEYLTKYDKRFGFPNLWTVWEDALKIHHLVTNGWSSWARKEHWLMQHGRPYVLQDMAEEDMKVMG